jgi:hypothetical protein
VALVVDFPPNLMTVNDRAIIGENEALKWPLLE